MTDPQKLAEEAYPYRREANTGPIAYEKHKARVNKDRAAYLAGYKKGGEEVEKLMERESESSKQLESELIKRINTLIEERTDALRRVQKLMGLLKEEITRGAAIWNPWRDKEERLARWQSYCKEKGLTPNKTEPRDYTIDDFT